MMCRSLTLRFFLFIVLLQTCVRGGDVNDNLLSSCLNSHGVHNFTTLSTDTNSDYFKLLHASMQNPLFAKPTVSKPSFIVMPGSKEELSSTVHCCTRESWTIRLRSGGHSYEGLSYTADTPFVIVDMMNLNRISIDVLSETAWVESGATLGELYYAIAQSTDTLGFTAGWCPTVGSGGHISGGGFGMMSRKYGLAADNVVDAILIDSNGAILDREKMGDDVFWAIRGGGGGVWGAIYAWKIKLLPVPEKLTVFRVTKNVGIEDASSLLHKWQYVADELDEDFTVSVLGGVNGNDAWLMFLGLHLGRKDAAKTIIDEKFPELGLVDKEFQEMSWGESMAFLSGLDTISELNNRFLKFDERAFKTKVDFTKVSVPLNVFRHALEMLSEQPGGFIALNGFGGKMSEISTDFTPFPHRKGTKLMFEYIIAWNQDEESKIGEFSEWLAKFYDYLEPFVSKEPRVGYVNHIDLDIGGIDWRNKSSTTNAVEIARNWGERYFSSNYERLVKAKTLIDPNNVFNHPQSIPPMMKFEEIYMLKEL
ncbi:reticuline oxidase [Papaver somniferum]|uniref:Reticuline oxidase n=1 Tax=Papaver somniferum TaxID=3469 RepID=RETO_PAPSO|nr:reticuline oxidase precursor [Papaver somniferum]P93479.1 RecName: Full=Reticuline oxidase; AltName: Full=Berberine bridge-forming enzyme; Short=BBE; AltName: Full=Tetrahydroprotoberberine synthase; Flags: Precursor [Papaver somniferum]AAC61839.1 berberine bridge enzyme [Papaver somniferum]